MKKFIAILTCCVCLIFSSGCVNKTGSHDNETSIELNLDNYQYYLNLDYTVTGSTFAPGIGYFYSYKLTFSSAIEGLYVDCVLHYEVKLENNDSEGDIKLNAAGYAQIGYSGRLTITSVSGKIIS